MCRYGSLVNISSSGKRDIFKGEPEKKQIYSTGVINDPLGQPTVPVFAWFLNFRTDGRTDGQNLCENSDHYRPGTVVGLVDQYIRQEFLRVFFISFPYLFHLSHVAMCQKFILHIVVLSENACWELLHFSVFRFLRIGQFHSFVTNWSVCLFVFFFHRVLLKEKPEKTIHVNSLPRRFF